MSIGLRQTQQMGLRQLMLPQMLQSMAILQMPLPQLLEHIEQQLESNEVLAWDQRRSEPALAGFLPQAGQQASRETRRRKEELMQQVAAPGLSLEEHVRAQLAWLGTAPDMTRAVLWLLQQLDAAGLLPGVPRAAARDAGIDDRLLDEALALLQRLEPRGLGAATTIDAILLQLEGDPDREDIARLLGNHLDDLARNRLPEVAEAMELSVEALRELLERMRSLELRPAASLQGGVEPPMHADARAWLEEGEVLVALADEVMPGLGIDRSYVALFRRRATDATVRDYLRPKVRAARELIMALEDRRATLRRVVTEVMRRQRRFLEHGITAIRPLAMAQVAGALDVHASTVSRAIAGKNLQTPHGVIRLRDFFDGAGETEGDSAGRTAVRRMVADLVRDEDPARPLSDDDIVVALRERALKVSRRTVTKYRQELGIPASHLRRRHGERP